MRSEAERAFFNAVEFHEAAIRCSEFGGEGSHVALQPMAVCHALSVELYLKALVLFRKKEPWGHELLKLYSETLDEADRKAFAAHYMQLRNATEGRMLRELRAVSKAFVEWRYAHEDEKIGLYVDHSILSTFAKAAYLTVRDVAPEWSVIPHFHERIIEDRRFQFISAIGSGHSPELFDDRFRSSLLWMMVSKRNHPQSDITEGENDGLFVSAPLLNLQGQSAAFNVNVRRRANSQNCGTDETVKFGTIFPLSVIAGKPWLDCKRHP